MRTKHSLLIGLAAIWLLVVGACGGDDDAGTDDPPGDGTTTTTSAATAPDDDSEPDESPDDDTADATTSTESAASGPSETLAAITSRGSIAIGMPFELEPFRSGLDTGFEPELATAVAENLAPGVTVEFVERGGAANRFNNLATGTYDLLFGLSEHTISRESEANWSPPYLVNGVVALVMAGSGIETVDDLAGTDVVTLDGNLTATRFNEALAAASVTPGTTSTVQSPPQATEAVRGGTADAYAMGWIEAMVEMSKPGGEVFAVVPVDVLSQPIAIASASADPAFAQEVGAALDAVIAEGTWLALAEQWLGGSPPWTVEEMAGVAPS